MIPLKRLSQTLVKMLKLIRNRLMMTTMMMMMMMMMMMTMIVTLKKSKPKLNFLIQDLQNARPRSEREQIISDFGDVHQMLICLQSKENTLMAEGDYKGGITAKAIIDGGLFEGLFVFPIQSNEILDSRKINSYLRIKM